MTEQGLSRWSHLFYFYYALTYVVNAAVQGAGHSVPHSTALPPASPPARGLRCPPALLRSARPHGYGEASILLSAECALISHLHFPGLPSMVSIF